MNSTTGTAAGGITNESPDGHVSERVATAVADATGVDPLDLDPLYTVVDPDALNGLFRRDDSSNSLELRFSMAGCEVVVYGDGDVDVTPMANDATVARDEN